MKIVFFGSSKYSVIDEKALFDACGLSLVVTTPDYPDKKTKQSVPNPVKQFALTHAIPIITADKLTVEVVAEIGKYQPDFLVVADFGLILPQTLLDLPKKAALNVHHSLLPKYRGPAPVPFAILAGETIVGVSIILMTDKVDAGDILAQEKYELKPDDTTDSVLTKLNQLGGALVVLVVQEFETYFKNRKPQDEKVATYSQYMDRNDGYIDLNDQSSIINAQLLDRKIRAYFQWPGVWSIIRIKDKGLRIKFLPGKIVQVEGKKPMSYKDFINGYPEGKAFLEKLGLL